MGDESGVVSISVKSPLSGREVTATKNLGATSAESVALFGEEVEHSIFLKGAIVMSQQVLRGVLDAVDSPSLKVIEQARLKHISKADIPKDQLTFTKTVEDAIAALAAWKPGVARRTAKVQKDAYEELADRIASGVISEKDAIAQIRAQIAKRKEQGA